MIKAYILALILLEPHPRHVLDEHPERLDEVERAFSAAGEKHKLDPFLLIYWAWQESRLNPDAVGSHPNPKGKVVEEKGICQVHGKAKKICKLAKLDVTTYQGGAACLAMLLDMGRRYCGSLEKGAAWYMSGSCYKAREKARNRLKAADRTSCKHRGGTWSKRRKRCVITQR